MQANKQKVQMGGGAQNLDTQCLHHNGTMRAQKENDAYTSETQQPTWGTEKCRERLVRRSVHTHSPGYARMHTVLSGRAGRRRHTAELALDECLRCLQVDCLRDINQLGDAGSVVDGDGRRQTNVGAAVPVTQHHLQRCFSRVRLRIHQQVRNVAGPVGVAPVVFGRVCGQQRRGT